MTERDRIAKQTIAGLRRFTAKLRNNEPFVMTRVQVEHTPDGLLTTRRKLMARWCNRHQCWGCAQCERQERRDG